MDYLRLGLGPWETVDAFADDCRASIDRLFVTDDWFRPFRDRLLKSLPPELPQNLLDALRDVVYKRRKLESVVEFIEQQPMTWGEYGRWCEERARAETLARARAGIVTWDDVARASSDVRLQRQHPFDAEATKGSPPCPGCNRPSSALKWIYFFRHYGSRSDYIETGGWLSICEPCHMQVDFVMTHGVIT